MVKRGFQTYYLFIPIAVVILFYMYKHMTATKIRTGPIMVATPHALDPGILANIDNTINRYNQLSQQGSTSSSHINPIPNILSYNGA